MVMKLDYVTGMWRPALVINNNMPSCYDKNENGDCTLFSPGEQKVAIAFDENGKPVRV
jgi:hypothetical protein